MRRTPGHAEEFKRTLPVVEPEFVARLRRGRVLDVGCGRGLALARFRGYGFGVVGLDLEPDLLQEASRSGDVLRGTGLQLPFGEAVFDAVTVYQVLHHLDDPKASLAEVQRVLRPEGYLLVWETVEDSPFVSVGRSVRPEWQGVAVRSRFGSAQLRSWLEQEDLVLVKELRWGTLALVASVIGQFLPGIARLGVSAWPLDAAFSRLLPFGHGWFACLAQKHG